MALRIRDIATRCLIELAVSLAIGTTAAFFTATSLQAMLIFAAITVQTIANASLRCSAELAKREPITEETKWIQSMSSYFCPTLFAYLTASNAQILIHESGHALAATWMFQNARPQITITPCLSGMTRFSTTHLSSWGKKIGRSNALLFATLMGPSCTLLISGIAIAVGLAVQEKFPEFGNYLSSVGRGDFYAHSFYALTALSSSPSGAANDFTRLHAYGIHPLASAALILAIPRMITRIFSKNGQDPGLRPAAY